MTGSPSLVASPPSLRKVPPPVAHPRKVSKLSQPVEEERRIQMVDNDNDDAPAPALPPRRPTDQGLMDREENDELSGWETLRPT